MQVSRIIPHSQYSSATLENDISLLKLSSSVSVVPGQIEILPIDQGTATHAGVIARTSGWGYVAEGTHILKSNFMYYTCLE